MKTDDMNSLDSVALGPQQLTLLGVALTEYDAPEIYWGEDSERSTDYKADVATEIVARVERRLQEDGLSGSAVAFSEEEYRVAIEALVQYDSEDASELISHLQWFKGSR